MDPGRLRIRIRSHPEQRKRARKNFDVIKNFDVSQKVWVGGLTDAVTWKALQELVVQSAHRLREGIGVVVEVLPRF